MAVMNSLSLVLVMVQKMLAEISGTEYTSIFRQSFVLIRPPI